MTPVQMFRDRWECGHIGTVIFAVQAVLLVPYIIIGIMGGGTTLNAISGGRVPFWFGGAIVAMVVMSYVFFGGMRGTAWVNTFQTILFLVFGAIAVASSARGWAASPARSRRWRNSPRLRAAPDARKRISPYYFFSYTFIPLSAIAFPHIAIFCLTAKKMSQFKKTVILYPLCIMAIWLPCVFLGVMANRVTDVPRDSRQAGSATRARHAGQDAAARAARRAAREVCGRRRDSAAARTLRPALARGPARRGHHGRRHGLGLADPRALDDVHGGCLRLLRRQGALRRIRAGADRAHLRHHPDDPRLRRRAARARVDFRDSPSSTPSPASPRSRRF